MSVAIGSDHAGFNLKEFVRKHLESKNIDIIDFGTADEQSTDYPDYAVKVGRAVAEKEAAWGIVICGTGIGVSIVANKLKGIRAALCCSEYMAEMARKHNDANVLAMGGRTTSPDIAKRIVDIFLSTDFEGGKHSVRVGKIHSLTKR